MVESEHGAFVRACAEAFGRAEVVSFDVFDTVLERPFARPTDLFEFVSDDVAHVLGRPIAFRDARVAAERGARRRARARGRSEVTLAEIYDLLREQLGLSPSETERIREIELAMERACLAPRRVGRTLYELARAQGRRIAFVSDMYLPQAFLEEVLATNGFTGYERLFVSSDVGHTKASGRLFGHVARTLGVAPARIVHVGDNVRADVDRARTEGLVAIHLPGAHEVHAEGRRRVFGTSSASLPLGTRALVTHAARVLHDVPDERPVPPSMFGGDAHRLGVEGFGPLLLAFTKWLVETAIARGYRRLFFLARDGRIMLDAYRIVAAAYPNAPEASYLLCSRRAANVASIVGPDDLASRAMPRRAPSSIAEFLEGRFGVAPSALPRDVLARHGMTPESTVTTPDVARVARLLDDLAPLLLEVAARERAAYLAYMASVGLTREGRAAVVDIGYRGSMQASIDGLLGGAGLGGLYLLTLYEAEDLVVARGLPIEGYLGQLVDSTRGFHALGTFIPVYETLFSGTDTSLVCFREGPNGPAPVFMPEDDSERRRIAVIAEVHRGALELVRRVVASFGPRLERLVLRPEDAIATLDTYLSAPDPEDARILGEVPFENAYCAAGSIPVVPHDGRGESMWPEGALTLRFARGPISRVLTRALLEVYGSPLGKGIRVIPKRLAHAIIGNLASTAEARRAVRNPIAYARDRRTALYALARRARASRSPTDD